MDVQTIRYPEAAGAAPRPEGCEVKLLDWYKRPPAGCSDVADVYVGDPGWYLICGREATERLVVAEACRVGADTALLRRVDDKSSACFEARARLLRCAAAESASP
jgi:hypothetical protein